MLLGVQKTLAWRQNVSKTLCRLHALMMEPTTTGWHSSRRGSCRRWVVGMAKQCVTKFILVHAKGSFFSYCNYEVRRGQLILFHSGSLARVWLNKIGIWYIFHVGLSHSLARLDKKCHRIHQFLESTVRISFSFVTAGHFLVAGVRHGKTQERLKEKMKARTNERTNESPT